MAEGGVQNITSPPRNISRSNASSKQTVEPEGDDRADRVSRVDRFVYLGLIPGAFAAVLIAVVLAFYNIDVIAYGKKGYDALLSLLHIAQSGPSEQTTDPSIAPSQTATDANIPNRVSDAQTTPDQGVLAADEARIKNLEDELAALKAQLQAIENNIQQRDEMLQKRREALQSQSRLLQAMNPTKAAAILGQMGWYEAAELVDMLNAENKAQVLAKLPPQTAAGIMAVLREGLTAEKLAEYAQHDLLKRLTQAYDALYAQIKQSGGTPVQPAVQDVIASSGSPYFPSNVGDSSLAQLTLTAASLSSIQPLKAAQMIEQMIKNGKKTDALRLLSTLDASKRGLILEALNPSISADLLSQWITAP